MDSCRNTSSPIWTIDAVYTTANALVCQAGCPCYANKTLWNGTESNTEVETTEDATLKERLIAKAAAAQSAAASFSMFESDTWAHNYQDCNLTQAVLDVSEYVLTNATKNAKFGMTALGAVETDFACAGMCGESSFFSFSEVSRGPPQ
jgi:hypothetical protein